MEMNYVTDNTSARSVIVQFLMAEGANLPTDIRDGLMKDQASPSIVDAVVTVAERIFANADKLPKSALVLGAQLATFRKANDWHKAEEGGKDRAEGLMLALMRDAGEPAPQGMAYPPATDDPAPLATYVPEAVAAPLPAPAPAG
jgi:hypothetical protein